MALLLHHRREPDHGDDGVQHKREEEVFVEGDPLTAQTPAGTGHTGSHPRSLIRALSHVMETEMVSPLQNYEASGILTPRTSDCVD